MLASIAVLVLLLASWSVGWWMFRHPAEPDGRAPRLMSDPPLSAEAAWLADNFGLNFADRQAVLLAAHTGRVIDPDRLRPAVVGYARWLRERRPEGWRRRARTTLLAAGAVLLPIGGIGIELRLGVRDLTELGFSGLTVCLVGTLVVWAIMDLTGYPVDLPARAERVNDEAPPGPGPDHPSRVPPIRWEQWPLP